MVMLISESLRYYLTNPSWLKESISRIATEYFLLLLSLEVFASLGISGQFSIRTFVCLPIWGRYLCAPTYEEDMEGYLSKVQWMGDRLQPWVCLCKTFNRQLAEYSEPVSQIDFVSEQGQNFERSSFGNPSLIWTLKRLHGHDKVLKVVLLSFNRNSVTHLLTYRFTCDEHRAVVTTEGNPSTL